MRYVEVNPRRAGLPEQLEDWEFSSAKAHLTGVPDPLLPLAEEIGRRRFTAAQWREFLDGADAEKERALRLALKGSRPCGAAEWIVTLEEKFKRKLSSPSRGRPRGVLLSPATA